LEYWIDGDREKRSCGGQNPKFQWFRNCKTFNLKEKEKWHREFGQLQSNEMERSERLHMK
jgi:hypothetical protein